MYPIPGTLPPACSIHKKWGSGFKIRGFLLISIEAQDTGRICEPQASRSLLPLLPVTWEGMSYVAKCPQGQHQLVEMNVGLQM